MRAKLCKVSYRRNRHPHFFQTTNQGYPYGNSDPEYQQQTAIQLFLPPDAIGQVVVFSQKQQSQTILLEVRNPSRLYPHKQVYEAT